MISTETKIHSSLRLVPSRRHLSMYEMMLYATSTWMITARSSAQDKDKGPYRTWSSAYLISRPLTQSFLRASTFPAFRLAFVPNRSDECVVRCTQHKGDNDEHAGNDDGGNGKYEKDEG